MGNQIAGGCNLLDRKWSNSLVDEKSINYHYFFILCYVELSEILGRWRYIIIIIKENNIGLKFLIQNTWKDSKHVLVSSF